MTVHEAVALEEQPLQPGHERVAPRAGRRPDVAIEHLYSPFTDEKNRALHQWFEY